MSSYRISILPENRVDEAHNLMKRCFEVNLHSIFFLHPKTTLVVFFEDSIVAGLNLDVYKVNKHVTMGYIGWLYTDSDHRGNGLAKRLLEEALGFCETLGCTDIAGCVEGDNPASFKQLERSGFKRLGLFGQIKRFHTGLFRVYRHASRFFDMGYFLWHKSLDERASKEEATNAKALLYGLLANTLLFIPVYFQGNLLNLFSITLIPVEQKPIALLLPSLTILLRTLAMYLVAKMYATKVEYHMWDTAYITAIGFALITGLSFPVPGNLYIQGSNWSIKENGGLLARMGLASVLSSAGLLILFNYYSLYPYPLILLIMDTLFFFYPFCGFNASRIKRGSMKTKFAALSVLLVCLLFLFYQ